MRTLLRQEMLAEWLQTVGTKPLGTVFTSDVTDVSAAIAETLSSGREPLRVVTLSWQAVPALSNELGLLVTALAEATTKLYPDLYGTTHTSSDNWPEADLEIAAHEIKRRVPGVLSAACRRILTAGRNRQVPSIPRMSNTQQVRQLALAIEPHRLVIIIAVHDAKAPSASLRALAQGAEWLATNTRAAVRLVLPYELRCAIELDHVTYAACCFANDAEAAAGSKPVPGANSTTSPATLPANTKVPPVQSAPASVKVSPVEGKPHPRSEAEQALYEHILKDARLCEIFSYNRRVDTRYGSSPIVDLLSAKHKLVVEIDGDDHRGLITWTNDRKRDTELLLSGYRVLRFPNSTLLENVDLVLSRLRDAVELIESQEMNR